MDKGFEFFSDELKKHMARKTLWEATDSKRKIEMFENKEDLLHIDEVIEDGGFYEGN